MSNFSPENHYDLKIKNGSIRDQNATLKFDDPPFKSKDFKIEKGFKRIKKDNFKYAEFVDIHQMHTEYLTKLKGHHNPDTFLELIYKAELTGASIEINNKIGFVIEERKNSLTVIFPDDSIKIFPKAVFNFNIIFEGIKYIFFANSLKHSRLIKG